MNEVLIHCISEGKDITVVLWKTKPQKATKTWINIMQDAIVFYLYLFCCCCGNVCFHLLLFLV